MKKKKFDLDFDLKYGVGRRLLDFFELFLLGGAAFSAYILYVGIMKSNRLCLILGPIALVVTTVTFIVVYKLDPIRHKEKKEKQNTCQEKPKENLQKNQSESSQDNQSTVDKNSGDSC